MAIGDLFNSKREREREKERQRRRAFRAAENAVDAVKARRAKLKAERDQAWVEARQYLKDGQRAAAQRCLQSVRACELLMAKLEMKRWVFEQLLSRLELAKTDQEFAQALSDINSVVGVDPEKVAEALDDTAETLGEQDDIDAYWKRLHDKQMEGVQMDMTDVVPSLEEMQRQLEDEVAAELGEEGAPQATEKTSQSDSGIKDAIGEGRRRLKDLMEEDK